MQGNKPSKKLLMNSVQTRPSQGGGETLKDKIQGSLKGHKMKIKISGKEKLWIKSRGESKSRT